LLLLDTHIWLWMTADPERIGPTTRAQLQDPTTPLLLSAASSWEVAIKYALGKLRLPAPPAELIPRHAARQGVTLLPVEHAHALRVATLPWHHRDPFDRLLIAQSLILGVPIVTVDDQLRAYGATLIDAAV
jgi:PIN domain nuclease of toxin-antitoxin system